MHAVVDDVRRRRRLPAEWVSILRNACYLVFGVWAVINTVRTPNFGWLHMIFIVFALGFVAVGAMLELERRRMRRLGWSGHLIVGVSMLVLGLLLLIIGRSPFGLLCAGLGLQEALLAQAWRRAIPGAGDGPSTSG